jgi:hypothetical protein
MVIPPLLRYLFSACCTQAAHSLNVNNTGHAKQLLTDTIGLWNCLKKLVSDLGLSSCRVLDSCCVTDCIPTARIIIRLEALKTVTARDRVQFLSIGYDHLVRSILHTDAIASSGRDRMPDASKSHFWRGFRSTAGSAVTTTNDRPSSRGRGGHGRGRSFRGGNRHHPSHPSRKY